MTGSVDRSFTDFVTANGHGLAKFAALLCDDVHQAEDLVQDALAAAYVHWRRIEQMESPNGYVRRTIVNRRISAWRRVRGREIPSGALPDRTVPDGADASALSDAVYNLVRQLPARQRAAVVLRYYCDYPDAEIADVLGCSASTVRSQIARALASLRLITDADLEPCERTSP